MINESSLLSSLGSLKRYSARDLADLAFLYLIALHILRNDFDSADWAENYARKSRSPDWASTASHNTDLYQFLHHLMGGRSVANLKDPTHSRILLDDITLSPIQVSLFLKNVQHQPYDSNLAARSLLKFEHDLRIQNSNYRSVRRIAADWLTLADTEAKSLAVTRLIQAIQHRAPSSDILSHLTKMAHQERLHLASVCDPETGKGCASSNSKPGLLAQLAATAGLTVGAYLLGKALFSK